MPHPTHFLMSAPGESKKRVPGEGKKATVVGANGKKMVSVLQPGVELVHPVLGRLVAGKRIGKGSYSEVFEVTAPDVRPSDRDIVACMRHYSTLPLHARPLCIKVDFLTEGPPKGYLRKEAKMLLSTSVTGNRTPQYVAFGRKKCPAGEDGKCSACLRDTGQSVRSSVSHSSTEQQCCGFDYMVMERGLCNLSLIRRLSKKQRLPLDVACCYAWQMMEAVRHLHFSGVVHRDVKPSNFVIPYNYSRVPSITATDPPQSYCVFRNAHYNPSCHSKVRSSDNVRFGLPTYQQRNGRYLEYGPHNSALWIIDFGMSVAIDYPFGESGCPFRSMRECEKADSLPARPSKSPRGDHFKGTSCYSSLSMQKGRPAGPLDDLWSVLFAWVVLAHGSLPWDKNSGKAILTMKNIYFGKDTYQRQLPLFGELPKCFLAYIKLLYEFEESNVVDYRRVRRVFLDELCASEMQTFATVGAQVTLEKRVLQRFSRELSKSNAHDGHEEEVRELWRKARGLYSALGSGAGLSAKRPGVLEERPRLDSKRRSHDLRRRHDGY